MLVVRKTIAIRLTGVFLTICCLGCVPFDVCAQNHHDSDSPHSPWACVFLNRDTETEQELKDDPPLEQDYERSLKEFYRLWCTATRGTSQDRHNAEDKVAVQWKSLWYRDDPFNAEFHETGSFGLLVLMAVTHRVPEPMVNDGTFLNDWLNDCSDRCFMVYGDDDPGARQEWLRLMRLRKEVMVHLGGDPATRPVLKMLKNAKLYPVN
jgi:hypothetical protein